MNRKITKFTILLILCTIIASGCTSKNNAKEFIHLKKISELATLKTYYHNVADMEHPGFFLGIGFKKIWVEYSGIVKIGIDPIKISISNPDEQGKVKVTIPKAKVLSIDFDENSIKEFSESNIPFNGFSTLEKLEALSDAQDDMKSKVSNDMNLLMQGQDRAKEVIEKYIQSVGNSIGKTYTVEWIELNEE